MPKITALPPGATIAPLDVFPFVNVASGVTDKVTFNTLQSAVANAGVVQQLIAAGAAASPFLQTGAGALPRSFQSKNQDTISVKDDGAVGDGVANDTAQFNSRILASDEVEVPIGTYLLNALTSFRLRNLQLTGAGRASKLNFNTSGKGITAGPSIAGDQKYTLAIRNLAFGNVTNVPTAFISQEFYINSVFEKLYFSGVAATYCIDQVSGYGTTIKDCVFSDVTGTAIRFRDNNASPNYSYAAGVENCDITRCSANGIEVEATPNGPLKITKTVIEGCVNGIITSTNASGLSAQIECSSVYFEANSAAHIDLGTDGNTYWGRAVCIACWFNGGTIKLGSKSKIVFVGIQGSGGAPVTVAGSANAEAVFIGCEMASFIQSGSFAWTIIGYNGATTIGGTIASGALTATKDSDHTNNLSGGVTARSAANTNKLMVMGYDSTADNGYLQAVHNGVSVKTLALNPSGGGLALGIATSLSTFGTMKPLTPGGYLASDASPGITASFTSTNMGGKTLTIKDGIITGFA